MGVVSESGRVDRHGWAATLLIERDLGVNPQATSGGAAGSAPGIQRIAWEELAEERPARFRDGERILVALDPMPSYSLWRKRFPQGDVMAVADEGNAFLRDPDPRTIDLLSSYLRLAKEEREQTAGVALLAAMVAEATPPIAQAALARLGEIPGLAQRLEGAADDALARALADADRPSALRAALLQLIAERRLTELRDAVEPLTRGGPPLAAPAWAALGAIEGGIPEDPVGRLLASHDPAVRAVAVHFAARGELASRVERMSASDASPQVRAAAVRALVDARGRDALRPALAALVDPAPSVRAEAAQVVARFGAEVVPELRQIAVAHSGAEASGALAALAFAGPEGRAVLLELSKSHPDEKTRGLARLFLGQSVKPPH